MRLLEIGVVVEAVELRVPVLLGTGVAPWIWALEEEVGGCSGPTVVAVWLAAEARWRFLWGLDIRWTGSEIGKRRRR